MTWSRRCATTEPSSDTVFVAVTRAASAARRRLQSRAHLAACDRAPSVIRRHDEGLEGLLAHLGDQQSSLAAGWATHDQRIATLVGQPDACAVEKWGLPRGRGRRELVLAPDTVALTQALSVTPTTALMVGR